MTGHTKEPWAFQYDHDYTLDEVNGFFVQGADGTEIFYADNDDRPETGGNLKRAAECVTALATIPDPQAFMEAARGMREALEALWKAADSMGHTHNSSTADAQIMAACDAIAAFDAAQGEQ